MHERQPFGLNFGSTLNEKIISLHHLFVDNIERSLEVNLLLLEAVFLLFDEVLQAIQLLLNLSESSCVYLLKLLIDAHLVLLELLDLFEDFHALTAAGVHEGVSCGAPVEALNTGLNSTIKQIQVLFEQKLLLVGDSMHDGVVVSHNQHHIFSKDPKLFFLSK